MCIQFKYFPCLSNRVLCYFEKPDLRKLAIGVKYLYSEIGAQKQHLWQYTCAHKCLQRCHFAGVQPGSSQGYEPPPPGSLKHTHTQAEQYRRLPPLQPCREEKGEVKKGKRWEERSEIKVENGDENGEKCNASESGSEETDGSEQFCPAGGIFECAGRGVCVFVNISTSCGLSASTPPSPLSLHWTVLSAS